MTTRTTSSTPRQTFDAALQAPHRRLVDHRLYGIVRDERTLRLFMQSHVFAVWDFQSLLKALQREMTCVDVPWLPAGDPEACRLINEIVLDEESDRMPDGRHRSHFEMYLEAMRQCGADTRPIELFIEELRSCLALGHDPELVVRRALRRPHIPAGVRAFVTSTLEIAGSRSPHRIAAAFAFGREEVIPTMFQQLVETLSAHAPGEWGLMRFYLERHIGCDADEHGPAAERLLERLCGDDHKAWSEAADAAQVSLEARLRFWEQVAHSLEG